MEMDNRISNYSSRGNIQYSSNKLADSKSMSKTNQALDRDDDDSKVSPMYSTLNKRITAADIILFRGNHIGTIIKPSKNFILSFKLYPIGKVGDFGSILRYTSTSHDYGNYGDRWLALFFLPNSYGIQVNVDNPNHSYIDIYGVEAKKWNNMKIIAIADEISFYVNNVYRGKMSNTNRRQLDKVNVYASDKFYCPAYAKLT